MTVPIKHQTCRRERVVGRMKYGLRRNPFLEVRDIDPKIRQSTHDQVYGWHDVGEIPEYVVQHRVESLFGSIRRLLAFLVDAAELGDIDGQRWQFQEASDASCYGTGCCLDSEEDLGLKVTLMMRETSAEVDFNGKVLNFVSLLSTDE